MTFDEDFDTYVPQHDDVDKERPVEDAVRKLPCKVSDLDLQRPPGFVGQVADWIDDQCRYPRRKLAVASAIVAVGNIAGMRHEDLRDDATANLIAFCVAASSTGKEAVMQAFNDLHIRTGMQGAIHGSIKSSKEISSNVIEQQASFYNIDEIGIFMTKVRNAQKRGGNASWLEDVFGFVMSIFSKANSRVLMGGDVKRELRAMYSRQLSKAEEDGNDEAADRAAKFLRMVDEGFERPFMSIIGYTTPVTFNDIMDGETATQGLVGRALIVNEQDINPRPRHGFKKTPLPMGMHMRLLTLSGREDGQAGTVEWRGDRVPVATDNAADKMLADVLQWFLDYADDAAEATGEASVAMIRRAFEMVAKISFILAIPDGKRTVDHVRWAFAYVRAEVDAKVGLVFANDNAKARPEEAIAARILSMLDAEQGASVRVLSNRLKLSKEQVQEVLLKMEQNGIVEQKIGKRTYKGQPVVKWHPVEADKGAAAP